MKESNITYFAETDFRGQKQKFGIKSDDRSRHVYVIGKTGLGKSTLLENMAIQDIQNGHGLAFIDPHGASTEKLLDYIPPERVKDVIYIAPHDTEFPVAFNIMEDVGKDKRHLVANGLMASFKKIWPDVWSARMEYILNNILLALLEYPDSTILGVNRMLSDKDYRKKVVDNITDPSVRAFWVDEFAKYTEKFMTEAGAAIQNKIGQFISNPLIRNIIGQPKSTFDIRQLMDEKKIMIINLSKGRIGEINANLLGGMLITKIYLAAMSRADQSAAQMKELPPFYFYVDEFQSFVNETFADILAEARKYKLNLTIAHQYIEQMPEEVRDAVFGNVGTTICFRVGPFDAEVMEKLFSPKFLMQDIVSLGFAQIYLTLMIDGVGSQPFSGRTLPPIPAPKESLRHLVVEHSRRNFGHPREEVEDVIRKWHESIHQTIEKEIPGERKPARRVTAVKAAPVATASSAVPTAAEKGSGAFSQNPKTQVGAEKAPDPFKRHATTSPSAVVSTQAASLEVPTPPPPHTPKTVSLKSLATERKGQAKNLNDLRSALQAVLEKEATTKIKATTPVAVQKKSPTPPPQPKVEEKKEETKYTPQKKEVPEDVLKKILDAGEGMG